MLRTDFLNKLRIAQPALASNELIPQLACYWFRGSSIMTYNSQIAISVPCKTDFKGAVAGGTLLSLLQNSRAEKLDFIPDDKILQIKMASTKLKLPMMPPDVFSMAMPKPSEDDFPVKLTDFAAAVKSTLRSVGADTSAPDQLGITIIQDDGHLLLFATNDNTLSRTVIKMTGKTKFTRAVLSAQFCKQLVSIVEESKSATLEINDKYSLLITDKDVMLFGELIKANNETDYLGTIDRTLPENYEKKLVKIPDKLRLMLERAIIITSSPTDPTQTDVTIEDNKDGDRIMKFFSSHDLRGDVSDSVQLESKQGHVEMRINPVLIRDGYDDFKEEKMLITPKCFIMVKGRNLYLVAATGS